MGSNPANGGSGREGTIYGWWLIWGRCPAAAVAFKHCLTTSSASRCLRVCSHCSDHENRNGRLWSVCHVGQALQPLVEQIVGRTRVALEGPAEPGSPSKVNIKRSFSLNHSNASSRSTATVVVTTSCPSISWRLYRIRRIGSYWRSRLYYDKSGRSHPRLMRILSCCRRSGKVLIDSLGMRPTSEARPMSARVATARQPLDRSR
jgi:hypothetical protein